MDKIAIIKDLILPTVSILVSIAAINKSSKSEEKANEANAKSEEILSIANKISMGKLELDMSSMINQTENRVVDLSIVLSKYFRENLTETEKKEKDILVGCYNQAIESNLNAYEEACAKYLDNKTDKERFKRMYNRPIRQLVENDSLEKYFKSTSSSYKCILKIYDEWNNLEK